MRTQKDPASRLNTVKLCNLDLMGICFSHGNLNLCFLQATAEQMGLKIKAMERDLVTRNLTTSPVRVASVPA